MPLVGVRSLIDTGTPCSGPRRARRRAAAVAFFAASSAGSAATVQYAFRRGFTRSRRASTACTSSSGETAPRAISGTSFVAGMKQRSRSATGQLLSRGHGQVIDAVGIADVVEANGRVGAERAHGAEEVHAGVVVHRRPRGVAEGDGADSARPDGLVDGRHGGQKARAQRPAAALDQDERPLVRERVVRAALPPRLVEEAPGDEVEADEHEGDPPQDEEPRYRRAVAFPEYAETEHARLPHEREAAPQEAERHQEDVDALEDHARVGLARPQQALAAEQLTLQAQLGERHLPPRTFRGSSASLNPSPM